MKDEEMNKADSRPSNLKSAEVCNPIPHTSKQPKAATSHLIPHTSEDERYMRMALREAEKAFDEKEIPIGCVIVKDGVVIGKGHNQIEMLRDATAHAEILSIGTAAGKLENWRLDGCTLYVTLEPCPMCAGAILNSRVSRVVYGSQDTRFGGCGTTIDVISNNALKREVEVVGGLLAEECLGLLKAFFQRMRLEKGDSGNKGPQN